jgi:hypothetical protein
LLEPKGKVNLEMTVISIWRIVNCDWCMQYEKLVCRYTGLPIRVPN